MLVIAVGIVIDLLEDDATVVDKGAENVVVELDSVIGEKEALFNSNVQCDDGIFNGEEEFKDMKTCESFRRCRNT